MSRTSPAAPARSAPARRLARSRTATRLLIGGAGPLLTSPAINPNVGYDALRDFSHIAMIAGDGYVLISNPASKLKTFADARQASSHNALTVGSPGAGSLGHLIIEQIKRKAGMQLQHVPFRSAGETMTAVLGDHVAMAIQTFSSAGEQVRAGKVIGLAVTSDERVPAFKDSPTFAELGLGEIGGVAWFWLTAPAKLSPDIVGKLNAEVRRIVKLPQVRQRFENDALVTMDVDAPTLTSAHRQRGGNLGSARQGPRLAGAVAFYCCSTAPHTVQCHCPLLLTPHMPHCQQAERHRRGEVQPGLISGAELVAHRHDA